MTYIFIIDTEQYSVNFEREMAAAMTGECPEYSSKQAEQLAQATWKEIVPDLAKFQPPISKILAEAGSYNDHTPHSFVSIWPTEGWFNSGCGEFRKDENQTQSERYPAYLSVAIFFSEEPIIKHIKDMLRRAKAYAADNGITVTGLRLLKETIKHEEIIAERLDSEKMRDRVKGLLVSKFASATHAKVVGITTEAYKYLYLEIESVEGIIMQLKGYPKTCIIHADDQGDEFTYIHNQCLEGEGTPIHKIFALRADKKPDEVAET